MTALKTHAEVVSMVPDAFRSDFGQLAHGAPGECYSPTRVPEVCDAIVAARDKNVSVTVRGAGLSQSGQSVATSGVCLALGGLNRIIRVDRELQIAHVQAGVTWRDLVDACRVVGCVPAVLPLNLDITVGGSLSVGGIGSNAHRHGPIVANVESLEVVTSEGRVVSCSADENRDYFDATLAGLGRCGVIVAATLRLRKQPPRVRTYYLLYDDLDTWLDDQVKLKNQAACHHMEGFFTSSIQGLRQGDHGGRLPFAQWFYGLHVSVEFEGDAPDDAMVVENLRPYRRVHTEDLSANAFCHRYQPRFESMRRLGTWGGIHPWIEAFLPLDVARQHLPELLDAVPLYLGDGHRCMFIDPRRRPPFFVLPEATDVVAFAVLPTQVPPPLREHALSALTELHQKIVTMGGKRYLSGWMGMMTPGEWSGHFGDAFEQWNAARRRLDPDRVFSSHFLEERERG